MTFPKTLVISGIQEEALSGDLFRKSAPVPESENEKERSQFDSIG